MRDYTVGQQPCQNFKQRMDGNENAMWGNVHECYCGHSKGNGCTKTVSFCENCYKDHHEGGYENCVCGGKGFDMAPNEGAKAINKGESNG